MARTADESQGGEGGASVVYETIALSDLTTDLTTGTNKAYWKSPITGTLNIPIFWVTTAPTGSTAVVDINKNGSTILSTKLSIDATETTSETAATPAVISDNSVSAGDVFSFDQDQVGSTVAGKGALVIMSVTPA